MRRAPEWDRLALLVGLLSLFTPLSIVEAAQRPPLEIERVHDCDGGVRKGKPADHLPAFDNVTPEAETCAGGDPTSAAGGTSQPTFASNFLGDGGGGGGGGGGTGHGAPAPQGGIVSALIGAAAVLVIARVRFARGR